MTSNLTFPREHLEIGLVLSGAIKDNWRQSATIMAGGLTYGHIP